MEKDIVFIASLSDDIENPYFGFHNPNDYPYRFGYKSINDLVHHLIDLICDIHPDYSDFRILAYLSRILESLRLNFYFEDDDLSISCCKEGVIWRPTGIETLNL